MLCFYAAIVKIDSSILERRLYILSKACKDGHPTQALPRKAYMEAQRAQTSWHKADMEVQKAAAVWPIPSQAALLCASAVILGNRFRL
jgi:hypothetical protein